MNTPLTEIHIFNPQGTIIPNGSRQTFPITDSCERNATIMNDDYIKLSFSLPNKVDFPAFSYIIYEGNRTETNQYFFLKEDYLPADKGGYYEYEMTFVSFADMLSKSICHRHIEIKDENDKITTWDEPEINLNATLEVMAELVLQSIHQAALRLPACKYTDMLKALELGTLQKDTSLLTYSFSGETIYNVLTQVANQNEVEWYIDNETSLHPKLHIVKCERYDTIALSDRFHKTGNPLRPTRSGGLLSCEYSQKWTDIPQFLIPYGSERNMTRKTSIANVAGAEMYVSYGKRLRLDPNTTYNIEDEDGNPITIETGKHGEIKNKGVTTGIEVVEMFDDVYPRCHYQVIAVAVEGTAETPKYVITAQAIDEATGNLLSGAQMYSEKLMPITLQEGQDLTIIFESGFLGGREFSVHDRSFKVAGEYAWNLILSIMAEGGEEDGAPMIPFGSFIPRVGDKFAMFGMEMPEGYINNAKQELAQKAYDKMLEIESTRPEVKCTADPNEFGNIQLVLGQRIAVQSDIFGTDAYVSRVTSFSHSLTTPNNVSFKLASSRVVGRLAEIQQAIADRTNDIQGLEQRTINISRRGWRDATEMAAMLDSLCAEMMLIGVEKNQFAFTSSIVCIDAQEGEWKKKFKSLSVSAGTLQHTQKPYIDYSNKGVWNIPARNLTETKLGNGNRLEPATAYYVYAVCLPPDSATNPNNEAEILLSSTTLSGTEYLLLGILSSEFEDTYDENNKTCQRVFNRSNGYTQIAGGTITTEQIQDPTRSLIIDFASNPPRIIARNGAEIIGNITFKMPDGTDVEDYINKRFEDINLGEIGGENLFNGTNPISLGTYDTGITLENGKKYVISASLKTGSYPVACYENFSNYTATKGTLGDWKTPEENVSVVIMGGGGTLSFGIQGPSYAKVTLNDLMVQLGDTKTTYQPYVEHLTNALKGSTEIAGGLTMTNLLLLKDELGAIIAGMSGLTDNNDTNNGVAMFAGGTYEQALKQAVKNVNTNTLSKILPILLTKTGVGSRIGCLKVVSETEVQVESSLGLISIDTASGGIRILKGGEEKIVIVPNDIANHYLPSNNTSKSFSKSFTAVNNATGTNFTSDTFTFPANKSHSFTITIQGSATFTSSSYEWSPGVSVILQRKSGSTWTNVKTIYVAGTGLMYSSPVTFTINHSQTYTDLGTAEVEMRLLVTASGGETHSVSITSWRISGSYVPTYIPKTVIGTDGILSAKDADTYFYVKEGDVTALKGTFYGKITANNGIVYGVKKITSDYTMTTADAFIICSVAQKTITLPSSPNTGQMVTIKNTAVGDGYGVYLHTSGGKKIRPSAYQDGGSATDEEGTIYTIRGGCTIIIIFDGSVWQVVSEMDF